MLRGRGERQPQAPTDPEEAQAVALAREYLRNMQSLAEAGEVDVDKAMEGALVTMLKGMPIERVLGLVAAALTREQIAEALLTNLVAPWRARQDRERLAAELREHAQYTRQVDIARIPPDTNVGITFYETSLWRRALTEPGPFELRPDLVCRRLKLMSLGDCVFRTIADVTLSRVDRQPGPPYLSVGTQVGLHRGMLWRPPANPETVLNFGDILSGETAGKWEEFACTKPSTDHQSTAPQIPLVVGGVSVQDVELFEGLGMTG